MKKVLITATVQSHVCQFHKPLIDLLHEHGYEVHVAARDNLSQKNGLKLDYVEKVINIPFSRSPLSFSNIKAYKLLKQLISRENYEIIHCNTPMGGVLTRFACKRARIKGALVIYTAHGFHFYKGASIKNWVFYYPIEKYLSKKTDAIITITNEDYILAKDKFKCRVFHTFGVGVRTAKFDSYSSEGSTQFRKDNGWSNNKIILCIGELNKNKNQIALVKSMPNILRLHENAILLLAGNGPYKDKIEQLISELNLKSKVIMLGYRTDLEKYVRSADVVVSLSKREGLPVNILEAMYCKKPVVASNNRGHRELIENNANGILLNIINPETVSIAIDSIFNNGNLVIEFVTKSYDKVQSYLDVEVKKQLASIYFDSLVRNDR